MAIIFPKNGHRLKDDGFKYLKIYLNSYSVTGKRGLFWHTLLLTKTFFYILRTISVVQTVKKHKSLAGIVATYPIPFLTLCKLLSLYVDRKRLDYFYNAVENEFWDTSIVDEKTQKKIKNRCLMVNTLNFGFILTANLALLFYLCTPFIEMQDGVRRLPNRIWFPVSTNPSPLHEIIFVLLVLNSIFSVMGITLFDSFFIYFSQQLSIQFILLSKLLENLDYGLMENASDDEKYHSEFFQKNIKERIKICARHHELLLKFGKNLEKFTYLVLVPQLCISMAASISSGFLLMEDHSEPFKSAIFFTLSSLSIIDLSIFALQSTDLNEQATSVKFSAYSSKWYLFKPSMRKDLCLTMVNSDFQEIRISAGEMQPINNEVIVTVIQRSWSAILLLRAMLDEDGAQSSPDSF